MKRFKTDYPGVFFREVDRIGGPGKERVYYIIFKKDGKTLEEKVGRQYADQMTAARAARVRAERIEGRRQSRKVLRAEEEAKKKAENAKWTIQRLWERYNSIRTKGTSLKPDKSRYDKYVAPLFGEKEPWEILPLDIERAKKEMKGKSPQTVKHVLNLLDRIVNYGVKRGLTGSISFKISKPKVNNLKTEDLTEDQLKRLLSAIDEDPNDQARSIMRLILVTGLRRGEIFHLQKKDLDFGRGFIYLRNPKGGKNETIPMNDAAKGILSEYLKSHGEPGTEYVFPGKGGSQRVDIRRAVNRIKNKAELPKDFRPLHGLRHYFASSLASSGEVDLHVLQRLLTHKDSRTTLRYAHLRDEALRKASNVAGQIIQSIGIDKKKEETVKLIK